MFQYELYQIIDNVATSKVSILITGESGTGKELCMEAIHKESRRKDKPIVAINCAAIPSNLMESLELLAYQTDGGTLFLDEIGEMDLIFLSYTWPGNVRQLENVIHNIVVLQQGPIVTVAMLPVLEEVLTSFTTEFRIRSGFNCYSKKYSSIMATWYIY